MSDKLQYSPGILSKYDSRIVVSNVDELYEIPIRELYSGLLAIVRIDDKTIPYIYDPDQKMYWRCLYDTPEILELLNALESVGINYIQYEMVRDKKHLFEIYIESHQHAQDVLSKICNDINNAVYINPDRNIGNKTIECNYDISLLELKQWHTMSPIRVKNVLQLSITNLNNLYSDDYEYGEVVLKDTASLIKVLIDELNKLNSKGE